MKKASNIHEFDGLRKKDFFSIIAITLVSVIIFLLIKKNFQQLDEQYTMFLYLAIVAGLVSILMGYSEARSNDPFVTGKTQTMGVVNSFVVAAVSIVILAFRFGIVFSVITMDVLLILSRELGRQSRKKLLEKYLGQQGKVIEANSKGKYTVALDSENKKVYSEEKLSVGDSVEIVNLKGTYLYVQKES